jgi:hypothetical protein
VERVDCGVVSASVWLHLYPCFLFISITYMITFLYFLACLQSMYQEIDGELASSCVSLTTSLNNMTTTENNSSDLDYCKKGYVSGIIFLQQL